MPINGHSSPAVLYNQFNYNISVLRSEFNVEMIEDDTQELAMYLSSTCNIKLLTKRVSYQMLARSILCSSLLKTYYQIPNSNLFSCRSTTYLFVKNYRHRINEWLISHGYLRMNQHRPARYSARDGVTLN